MKKLFILLLFTNCSKPISVEPKPKTTISLKELNLSSIDKKYNSEIIFYIDLSKSSKDYRFYVVRLKDTAILKQGLCCNGRTDKDGKVIYSNVVGSNCSSKGKYYVGSSYIGKFGKAYKLHGLDATNSNAYKRAVVLHSHYCIPKDPTSFSICKSFGCPTVNPEYLKELSFYIDNSKKPILLFIK